MSSALTHLAGRVWLYPHDPDPAKIQAADGVVADERGSVIVDAGHSPALARRVQAAMAGEGLPPARWLVYTHHHWDHVWGAVAWGDVEPPPLHLREAGDGLDLAMVRNLLDDDITWYVDAHSPPWTAADAAAMLAE